MKTYLTPQHYIKSLLAYAVIAILVFILSPMIGSEHLDLHQVWSDINTDTPWHPDTQIFMNQRLPRILLGMLVGGSLALIGAVFQVILRNPLATPHTLGITGGATVGAFIAIAWPPLTITKGPLSTVQLFALFGAALPLLVIYLISRRKQSASSVTILLTGVTIGIFCGAINMLIRYLADPDQLLPMTRWIMGGLDVVGYKPLASILPFLLPAVGMLLAQVPKLNHLALGDEMAAGHGIDVSAVQNICFIAGGVATTAVVSVVGPIGFVGLIVPHAIRRISGSDHRIVLPASFLAGGALLTACDALARTLVAPTEMPVGIFTALLGAPFFLSLLIKNNQR